MLTANKTFRFFEGALFALIGFVSWDRKAVGVHIECFTVTYKEKLSGSKNPIKMLLKWPPHLAAAGIGTRCAVHLVKSRAAASRQWAVWGTYFSSPAFVWRDLTKITYFASTSLKASNGPIVCQFKTFENFHILFPQSEVHIWLLQLHDLLIQLHAWLIWQETSTAVEILDTLPIVQHALLIRAVEFNSWNFIHFTNQATFFANWSAYFSSWFFFFVILHWSWEGSCSLKPAGIFP